MTSDRPRQRRPRKGVSRKASLGAGDALSKLVAAWRVAEALKADAACERTPSITYEGAESLRPWDDVVERWDDGTLHLYQVKSGKVLQRAQLLELFTRIRAHPNAKGTLVVGSSPRVPNLAGDLEGVVNVLDALRSGAAIDPKSDPIGKFLVEAWGSLAEAQNASQLVGIEFLGSRIGIRKRALDALTSVYEGNAVHDVVDAILGALDETRGRPVQVAGLRRGPLGRFEGRRRAPPAIEIAHPVRSQYLANLRAAVLARRVLRVLDESSTSLQSVWVQPRLRLARTECVDLLKLPDLLTKGAEHNLVGPAGSGKTELLARLASNLSAAAECDTNAPLPLVISLRDLEGSTETGSIIRAAERFSVGTGPPLSRLLENPTVRWTLLIDGVDEVRAGVELVAALRRRFVGATSLATLRPAVLAGLPPAEVFMVEPWRDSDAVGFLRQLAEVHPKAAEKLLRLTETVPGLIQTPLTATLAALITVQGGVVPTNRTRLFSDATEILVQTWADARGVKRPWKSVGPAMRAIALDAIKNERSTIPIPELDESLRRYAADEPLTIKRSVDREFGILIPTVDGYDFLVRGLAEFLAGEQLAERDEELVAACGKPWASDAGRHALALVAARDKAAFCRLLRQLLQRDPKAPEGLRGLLLAILASADNPSSTVELAGEVASSCLNALRNEASSWRSDRVADAVAELARDGGPAWRALRELVRTALRDHRTPAAYFAAQPSNAADWGEMLLHCDPGVRCEGVRRLAPDNPEAIDLLFTMLHDVPTFPRWGMTPAIESALALRRAPRDLLAEYVPVLRRLSETPLQLLSAAAAVALRPDEQDSASLVRAYRQGADGQYLPGVVLDDLAADGQGLEALERFWPEWRSYRANAVRAGESVPQQGTFEPPAPASDVTRARLLRVLSSERIADQDVTPDLLRGPGWDHYLEAICERAITDPSVIVAVLAIGPPTFPHFTHRAAMMLGSAASRHEVVRNQLLGLWERFLVYPLAKGSFPGRALEHLIVNGDAQAAEIYASWLPYAPYLSGMLNEEAPEPEVFRPSVTRRAVQERLADIVTRATLGYEQGGERFFVAAGSAARVFHKLVSVWRGDSIVTPTLIGWIDANDSEKSAAALSALEGSLLNQEQIARVTDVIRHFIQSQEPTDRFFRLPHLIPQIVRLGLVPSLISELRSLTNGPASVAIAAACALRNQVTSAELVTLSALVSQGPLDAVGFDVLDREAFVELVRLAPEAWSAAVFGRATVSVPPEIDLVLPILDALPVAERRALAQRLAEAVGDNWTLPWLANWRTNVAYRPSDLVDQILFDAGVS